MNQDWTYRKLGEACVLTMGQSPSSESYNKEGKGLPFFQGCSDFGKLNPTVKTFCNAPAKIAEIGDVLMSVRAPIGTLNIANVKCCIGRGLASFRALPNIDNMYLYYFLKHSNNCLQKLGTGSTFKTIGKESLYNFPIPVPPLAAQSRIVSELNLLQSIIDKQKAQLKELDNLAQAVFYDMFGVFDVPKFTLLELCNSKNDIKCGPFGTQLSKDEYKKNGIAVWGIPQINSHFTLSPSDFVTEEKASYLKDFSVIAGDIVMSRKGNVGQCCVFPESFASGIIHSDVLRLRLNSQKANSTFMMFQLHLSEDVKHQIQLVSSGAIMPGINVTKLKNIKVVVPPLSLQQSFAAKIESIEKQKAAISKSIEETQKLFDYTMDKYFG